MREHPLSGAAIDEQLTCAQMKSPCSGQVSTSSLVVRHVETETSLILSDLPMRLFGPLEDFLMISPSLLGLAQKEFKRANSQNLSDSTSGDPEPPHYSK
eukprot:s2119_g5.t1